MGYCRGYCRGEVLYGVLEGGVLLNCTSVTVDYLVVLGHCEN